MNEKNESLKDKCEKAKNYAIEKGKKTDKYVHDNPWKSAVIGAGLGFLGGIVTGMLIRRKWIGVIWEEFIQIDFVWTVTK